MNDDHTAHPSEDLLELLVPFALGELDQEDRVRVATALAEDPALRRELDRLEATGALVAASVPRVQAPPALRARVLDAVAAASGPRQHAAETVSDAPVSLDSARSRRELRRRWWMPQLATGFAAGAAAASIVFGAFAIGVGIGDESRTSSPSQSTTTRISDTAGFQDATFRDVSTRGKLADARGSLVRISGDTWVLVMRELPQPGAGHTWQVWTASDGGLENVAQWAAARNTQVIVLHARDIDKVMISDEASLRAVPLPTSAPVAEVSV